MDEFAIGITAGPSALEVLVERVAGSARQARKRVVQEHEGIREHVVVTMPKQLR